MARPVPAGGYVNGKPPVGVAGKYGLPAPSTSGTVLRSVSRGAVGVPVHGSRLLGPTHGTGAVIPVDRPKDPRRSKVFNKPAPMRSNTTPKPPRITVLSPLPSKLCRNPPLGL